MGLQFIKKNTRSGSGTTTTSTTPAPTPESISGLLASEIVTGLIKTSILVRPAGELAQTINMADLSLWMVTGNKLALYSKDAKPIELYFTSVPEAEAADIRVTNMINGASY